MSDEVKVVDNVGAADVFADDAMAFSIIDGTVRVTFVTTRWTQPPPGEPVRVVIGRLVMPVAAVQRLVVGLNDFLTKSGLAPSEAMKGDASVQ